VNKQNTRFWASKNLNTVMEISLLEKRIMWCAINTNGLTEVIYVKDNIKRQEYCNCKIRAQKSFRAEGYGHMTVIFDILHHASGSSVTSN
jgi:hypothetical protein